MHCIFFFPQSSDMRAGKCSLPTARGRNGLERPSIFTTCDSFPGIIFFFWFLTIKPKMHLSFAKSHLMRFLSPSLIHWQPRSKLLPRVLRLEMNLIKPFLTRRPFGCFPAVPLLSRLASPGGAFWLRINICTQKFMTHPRSSTCVTPGPAWVPPGAPLTTEFVLAPGRRPCPLSPRVASSGHPPWAAGSPGPGTSRRL